MTTCEGQYGVNEAQLLDTKDVHKCAANCLQQKGCTVFIHSQESTECWWQWVGHDFKCHKKRNLDKYNLYAVTPGVLPYLAHAFKKISKERAHTLHHIRCSTCACTGTHTRTIHTYIRTYTHTYAYIHTYIHKYIYIHIHTRARPPRTLVVIACSR